MLVAQLTRFVQALVPCSTWRPAADTPAEELREVDEFGAVGRKP